MSPKLFCWYIICLTYMGGMLVVLNSFIGNNSIFIKDEIEWILTYGIYLFFNSIKLIIDSNSVIAIIKNQFRIAIVGDYLINTFTFNFWIELILQPLIVVIMLDRRESLKRIQGIIGLVMFVWIIICLALEWRQTDWLVCLIEISLPILCTILILPVIYFFVIYAAYEQLFLHMHLNYCIFNKLSKFVIIKRRLRLIIKCKLSIYEIRSLKQWGAVTYYNMPDGEYNKLLREIALKGSKRL